MLLSEQPPVIPLYNYPHSKGKDNVYGAKAQLIISHVTPKTLITMPRKLNGWRQAWPRTPKGCRTMQRLTGQECREKVIGLRKLSGRHFLENMFKMVFLVLGEDLPTAAESGIAKSCGASKRPRAHEHDNTLKQAATVAARLQMHCPRSENSLGSAHFFFGFLDLSF